MTTRSDTFGLDAFIVGGRWRHSMTDDHFGAESDLNVAIDIPIGPWPQYTPIHYVVADLFDRIISMESSNRRVGGFSLNALIGMYFPLDAVIRALDLLGTFTLDAFLQGGGTFSFSAWVGGGGTFGLDAYIA